MLLAEAPTVPQCSCLELAARFPVLGLQLCRNAGGIGVVELRITKGKSSQSQKAVTPGKADIQAGSTGVCAAPWESGSNSAVLTVKQRFPNFLSRGPTQ